jgi:ArsR family transcriptional regulator, arsenate/arsenite/antimonite-responsive transcriptional repressor
MLDELMLDRINRHLSIYLYNLSRSMGNKHFRKIAEAPADPRRFASFQKIAMTPAEKIRWGAVCEEFSISQATVSHLLKALTEAGLHESSSKGQFKYLSAKTETMNQYIAELQNRRQTPKVKSRK